MSINITLMQRTALVLEVFPQSKTRDQIQALHEFHILECLNDAGINALDRRVLSAEKTCSKLAA